LSAQLREPQSCHSRQTAHGRLATLTAAFWSGDAPSALGRPLNSRKATLVQQRYAIANADRLACYGEFCWGIAATDGPGPARRKVRGETLNFQDYKARGVPFGPHDGCIAPWAVAASLPFAPEIVLPTFQHFIDMKLDEES
jgi:hypothetical protein